MHTGAPARFAGYRIVRTVAVLVVLGALSVWSWRSLIAAGILNHAPPYRQTGDVGQGILFVKWLPFALSHGLNPFHSRMMFAPRGINMLSNTAFFLPALVLAPLTAWLGPVGAFDIGVILAPVISGYALYWVLRRYEISGAAALIASVFYAYSPYMAQEVRLGHFNLSWMFFPPLLVFLLDEIFVRQQMRAWTSGLALGALCIAQYFNSPEILLDSALLAALLLAVAAATHPRSVPGRLKHAAISSAIAVLLAGAALAYPLWFAFRGPEHVTIFNTSVSTIENAVTSAVWPSAATVFGAKLSFLGRIDSGFVGPVVCLMLLASCLLWRRYRLVPYALLGAVVTYVLTWGPYLRVSSSGVTQVKGPDYWLLDLAVLRNIQEYRFAAFTDLFLAIAVASCLDWLARRSREHAGTGHVVSQVALASLAAAAVLAFPLIGGNWHQPVEAVSVPRVFTSGPLASSPVGSVAMVLPPGYINRGAPLVWQAVSGLRYDDTNGYAWHPVGHGGVGVTLTPTSPLTALLGPELLGQIPAPPASFSARSMYRLRATLLQFDVRNIVFARGYPDPHGSDASIVTAVVGERPRLIGGSLVWPEVFGHLSGPRPQYRGLDLAKASGLQS